jgi:hypothetical protein
MAPRSKEQELRDEIERFQIEFMGPLLPSEWPAQYQEPFGTIQRLGNTPWLQHRPENVDREPNEANRWRVQQRAYVLMNEAKANRRDRVNEPTLRGDTEPLVFERLKQAAKWYIGSASFLPKITGLTETCSKRCSNYRWWSDASAEPSNPADVERLKKRRSQRPICRCHPDEWTLDGLYARALYDCSRIER